MAGDLFGGSSSDSDDTDDLLAVSRGVKSRPVAIKKGGGGGKLQKKGAAKKRDDIPDADDGSDSDSDAGGGGGKAGKKEGGLFDSSSEEDSDDEYDGGAKKPKGKKKLGGKKPAAKKAASGGGDVAPKKKMSKKERMEALAKRHRHVSSPSAVDTDDKPKKKRRKTGKDGDGKTGADGKESGYKSGDSYDSATFERTEDDDDFIDNAGLDPDELKELYAEQHFDDERPDGSESEDEDGNRKKNAKYSGSGGARRGGGLDTISDDDEDEDGDGEKTNATSALKAAVKRMARGKKVAKKLGDLEDTAKEFLAEMDAAAETDEASVRARRPATKKLAMLSRVLDMLAKKDMYRPLLEFDLLTVCKRWVQPLPNGQLGNVTLRHKIIEAITNMTGDNGVNASDLKRSGFGKTIMTLWMHKKETPRLKKMMKNAIEQWSRPIFQKSGNMRDLERVRSARGTSQAGLSGIARAQSMAETGDEHKRRAAARGMPKSAGDRTAKTEDDLNHIISGKSKAKEAGNNRVSVPYSRGFQFSVRPSDRHGDVSDKRNMVSAQGASRKGKMGAEPKLGGLQKRMLEKNRPSNQQGQKSMTISISGKVQK